MKKSSRVISMLLAVLMTVSCFTGLSFASASAAETNTTIYFQIPDPTVEALAEWGTTKTVYCHIYHIYGEGNECEETNWGTRAEKCDFNAADGIASFNIATKLKAPLAEGNDYAVLFYTKDTDGNEHQTGNVTLAEACYGGTIYVTGNKTENTEDSSKLDFEARWTDAELNKTYGPRAAITSTGKIINDYFPAHQPKAELVAQWLASWAVLNETTMTPELVKQVRTDPRINVSAEAVYDSYVELYGETAGTGNVASLEKIRELLELPDPEPTTEEPTTVEPTTEEPTTVEPTTEEPTTEEPTTVEPTTEEPTTEEPTTVEPTTEEPTTEEPTTVEPTTEEPTTEEPTTVEPTTEAPTEPAGLVYGDVNRDGVITIDDATLIQKAAIELVELDAEQMDLADVNADGVVDILDVSYVQKYIVGSDYDTKLVGEPYTKKQTTYNVAGTSNLFNAEWDGSGATNVMELDETTGLYTLTITTDDAVEGTIQFKVVEHPAEGPAIWHGKDGGDFNYQFLVTGAGDVTITYDPATGIATYAGENVEEVPSLEFNSVVAVGNGDENWLYGESWNPGAEDNMMTEIQPGIWAITYEDIYKDDNFNVKFAINGEVTGWADNFGGKFDALDTPTDAVYNGDNIVFEVAEDGSTVTLVFDCTGFDPATMGGCKFAISVQSPEEPTTEEPTEEPTTEEPTTVEPTTEEPTTVEPTTEAPTEEPTTEAPAETTFCVAGTSNLFGAEWDGSGATNVMELDETTGLYTLTITTDDAVEGTIQFKVVEHPAEGPAIWHGKDGGDFNYQFLVTGAGDVTITYDPATGIATYAGENVEEVPSLEFNSVIAVGNGDENWLNGESWNPGSEDNMMTEIQPGIWAITYEDIFQDDNFNVKFAVNGEVTGWADNFGGKFEALDTQSDAVYNGDNIVFEVAEDGSTVTLVFDCTGFDPATMGGCKFAISVQSPEEPTTEEPTEEPTTEEPTTVEPTTEEPTTVEPTTEAPTEEPTTEAPAETTFCVAGTSNLFGAEWDGSGATNVMTKDGDVYTLTITTDDAVDGVIQFKVVELPEEGPAIWHGKDGGDFNYQFIVTGAGDVTITYDPATGIATYAGENVEEAPELEFNSVIAVGNGDENWLYGESWNPGAEDNMMTEIMPGIWAITYEDIFQDDNFNVKFAVNGEVTAWADNFGGKYEALDTPTDAVYNGDNIVFEVAEDGSTVTLVLDVTGFDFTTKSGAKFTISVEAPEEPTTEAPTEPTTEAPTEPTTEAPTEPTTEAPAESTFCVAGTDNLFVANWDGSGATNVMEKDGDVYTITIPADDAIGTVQFKVVELPEEGPAIWHGVDGGDFNYQFLVKGACDVTITYDPATATATYSGEFVEEVPGLEFNSVIAVGNGDENWLYGESWNPGAEDNMMTEIQPGIWAITYEDIFQDDNFNVKFAVNGEVTGWADNFGGKFEALDTQSDAVYNGDNIVFEVPEDGSTVVLVLDVTGFDPTTKSGAKFTISVFS